MPDRLNRHVTVRNKIFCLRVEEPFRIAQALHVQAFFVAVIVMDHPFRDTGRARDVLQSSLVITDVRKNGQRGVENFLMLGG